MDPVVSSDEAKASGTVAHSSSPPAGATSDMTSCGTLEATDTNTGSSSAGQAESDVEMDAEVESPSPLPSSSASVIDSHLAEKALQAAGFNRCVCVSALRLHLSDSEIMPISAVARCLHLGASASVKGHSIHT